MAFPVVTTGDLVSAADWNGLDPSTIRLRRTTGQTIPNITATNVSFTQSGSYSHNDDDGTLYEHAGVTDAWRFTIKVAGLYQITVGLEWASNATGSRRARIVDDTSTIVIAGDNRTAELNTRLTMDTGAIEVAASTNFRVAVEQTSGGNLDVISSAATFFAVQRLRV